MIADWILLIFLFAAIAIVPALQSPPSSTAMSPFQDLLNSVSLLVGLVLLALFLLVSGIALLVGLEKIQSRLFGVPAAEDVLSTEVKIDAPAASERKREGERVGSGIEMQDMSKHGLPAEAPPAAAASPSATTLRPFRAAKARLPSHDDKLYGLLLVIAGLSLLWIVPAYLLSSSSSPAHPLQPPLPLPQYGYGHEGPYSEKQRRSASKAGQGVLGIVTLLALVVSFALLKPDKSTDALHEGETDEARKLRKKEKWVLR